MTTNRSISGLLPNLTLLVYYEKEEHSYALDAAADNLNPVQNMPILPLNITLEV